MLSNGPSLRSPPSSTALVQNDGILVIGEPAKKGRALQGDPTGPPPGDESPPPSTSSSSFVSSSSSSCCRLLLADFDSIASACWEYPSLRQSFHPRHVRHRFRDAGLYLPSHHEHAHVGSSAASPSFEAAAATAFATMAGRCEYPSLTLSFHPRHDLHRLRSGLRGPPSLAAIFEASPCSSWPYVDHGLDRSVGKAAGGNRFFASGTGQADGLENGAARSFASWIGEAAAGTMAWRMGRPAAALFVARRGSIELRDPPL